MSAVFHYAQGISRRKPLGDLLGSASGVGGELRERAVPAYLPHIRNREAPLRGEPQYTGILGGYVPKVSRSIRT